MQKRDAPSKRVQFLGLVVIISVSATIFGCRGDKPAAPVAPAAAVATTDAQPRSKQQAMAALMALPELKAWSSHLEKSSGGKVRGALIEYDANPKLIDGKRYFQLSFVENGADAAHRWESFLVAESGNDILVEDAATDTTMTLDQWRKDKQPLARISAN
ncbi:hypothetical protein [Massilia eurypsychrophila]|jgi:hypothetical protein|nr:hypothetical protein [Massilia eurypsychrophila]